jgi:hypothetical protein
MKMDSRGGFRAFEYGRNLPAREIFLDLQEHRGALARRDLPERIVQADRCLAADRRQFRPGFLRGRIDRQTLGIIQRSGKRRQLAPPSITPLMVDAEVNHDSVEPGGESRTPVEAMGGFIKPDKRLLPDIASIRLVTENRAGKPTGARLIAFDYRLKGRRIARRNSPAQFLIAGLQTRRSRSPLHRFPAFTEAQAGLLAAGPILPRAIRWTKRAIDSFTFSVPALINVALTLGSGLRTRRNPDSAHPWEQFGKRL